MDTNMNRIRLALLAALLPCSAMAAPATVYEINVGQLTFDGTYVFPGFGTMPVAQNPSGTFSPLQSDASGNLNVNCTTCTGGGGGGASSVVKQGAQDATAQPWQSVLYQGGALVAAGNGLYIQPGTGAVFSISGSVVLNAGSASIGLVGLNAGANLVGAVNLDVGGVAVSTAAPLPQQTIPGGALAVAITPVTCAAAAGCVGKSSVGNLYKYKILAGTTAGFLAILPSATIPTGGATINPQECDPVAASTLVKYSDVIPDRYAGGITAVFSTSCTTYTAVSPVPVYISLSVE